MSVVTSHVTSDVSGSTSDQSVDPASATFEDRAQRIDAALSALGPLSVEDRRVADEAVAAIEAHQAAVLRSLVARLRADDRGRELLYDAIDDPEVHAALVKAGIVKPSLAMRALQVLDSVRPYIAGHGGDVELVRIEGSVAHVRLLGACQSCSSSTETLRDSVAEALLEHLPELSAVEEVPPDAAPVTAFIPVTSVVRRPKDPG
jgi:Fe-S cluster biogenesis protein NfuA